MTGNVRLALAEIEQRVCDATSVQLGIRRQRISPSSSLVEDLGCDSLDLVELIMTIEETFGVTLPSDAPNPVYKAIFTRSPFRLSDLAELVYVQQGTGTPERHGWRKIVAKPPDSRHHPVHATRWPLAKGRDEAGPPLLEPLRGGRASAAVPPAFATACGARHFPRRPSRSGAMRQTHCSTSGRNMSSRLDAFLIDAEPVSTTAYCRFLNSIGWREPRNP